MTCQETKTKAKARIYRPEMSREFAPDWLHSQTLSEDTVCGDDAQIALCSYYIRERCTVFIQFQELTGRSEKTVYNAYWQTSQGEHFQNQELIQSSIRSELLMLAGV